MPTFDIPNTRPEAKAGWTNVRRTGWPSQTNAVVVSEEETLDANNAGDGDSYLELGEFADRWVDMRFDLAERTVELYRWLLKRHISPTLGEIPIVMLSTPEIRAWHWRLATDRPTTAAKAYRLLSSIMWTAVSDGFVMRNPCQVRGASVERAPERPIASISEVEALRRAMPPRLQIAVDLAAWCQLRRAEVRGLRRKDVDLLEGNLTINITRTTSMAGHTIVKPPKTAAGRRTISIPRHVIKSLSQHFDSFVDQSPDALVVPGSNQQLSLAWNRARDQLNRPELRFHDLRHSGLTWSAATGASVAELMRRAGHSSATTSFRYQHATDDRDRVLADGLANLAGIAAAARG